MGIDLFGELKVWRQDRGLYLQPDKTKHFAYINEEISEGLRAESIYDVIDSYCDIIVFAINGIEQHGFDAEMCMVETLKEISSRTGSIDPITKKFEKDKSPEAVSKWYKADYSKCPTE